MSCIDFQLTSDLDLMISHLCIDSLYAEIELRDILIKWQFEASHLQGDKIVEAISAISVKSASISAKDNIASLANSTSTVEKNTLTLSDLPSLINKQFRDVSAIAIPIAIDIQTFTYQAYSDDNSKLTYQGQLAANAKQLSVSLTNQSQQKIFSLLLVKNQQGFDASLRTDLAHVRSLLSYHKAAFSPQIAGLLANATWSVKGLLESELLWHEKNLHITNQVTNFSFIAAEELTQLGPIEVTTDIAWNIGLIEEKLKFDFTHDTSDKPTLDNTLDLAFDQKKLVQALSTSASDQQLLALLKDNVVSNVSIIPMGSFNIDFTKQRIMSDGLIIRGKNLNAPLELSLKDLVFNYSNKPEVIAYFEQGKFSLIAPVKVAQLQPYSKSPVQLALKGKVNQYSDSWQLKLAQGTAIEITEFGLPTSQAQQEEIAVQPKMKSLISHWQGSVLLPKNELKSQGEKNTALTFDLQVNNQISQLNLPKFIQVETFAINSKLSGSLDNIAINAKVIADKLDVATIKLTGDVNHPSVVVSAQDVLLTDVLALQIKSPIVMNLIDGRLNYHLSGQLNNTEDIMANPMSLALSIQDLTGDIDGTWLQELNWQQEFIVQHSQVKSLTADHKGNGKAVNKLSIAKIETGIPITQLSTNTLIDFSEGEINLVAKNTRANLLGGRFDINQAQWPFSKDSVMNVKLTEIDLEKLLELDPKQGIVITGKVSGEMPISYDGNYFLIKEGSLQNVGEGLIQVYNNPAVEELKENNTELKLAFNALENLHYHHLYSAVSMADDGYMLLVTEIKGRNPDLDNEVNLNLNLSYDLLGLLESLNITKHFESKVIKGLQKNN